VKEKIIRHASPLVEIFHRRGGAVDGQWRHRFSRSWA
jgi:hypothetical protein